MVKSERCLVDAAAEQGRVIFGPDKADVIAAVSNGLFHPEESNPVSILWFSIRASRKCEDDGIVADWKRSLQIKRQFCKDEREGEKPNKEHSIMRECLVTLMQSHRPSTSHFERLQ